MLDYFYSFLFSDIFSNFFYFFKYSKHNYNQCQVITILNSFGLRFCCCFFWFSFTVSYVLLGLVIFHYELLTSLGKWFVGVLWCLGWRGYFSRVDLHLLLPSAWAIIFSSSEPLKSKFTAWIFFKPFKCCEIGL